MEIKIHSVQTVTIANMFMFEFIGDGCLLPENIKKAIFADVCDSIEYHLRQPVERGENETQETK